MTKLLLILSLTLGLATMSNAETWSCAYLFNGKAKNAIYVRQGDSFYSPRTEANYKIVLEDDTMITLHSSYNAISPTYFAILLDKTKKMFAMVGLRVGNHTAISEGHCEVY